jgi:hypothetical protein
VSDNGVMHQTQAQIPVEAIVVVMQREFPTEFRVCLQQAYIEQLEARVRELSEGS